MRFLLLSISTFTLLACSACEDPSKAVQSAEVKAAEAMKGAKDMATDNAAAAKDSAVNAKDMVKDKVAGVKASIKGDLPDGTVAISPKSTIGFVGSKVTGSHSGSFPAFKGNMTLKEGKLEGGSVNIEIDMSKVESDNQKLTGHLKSPDFFDVEKFPTSTFKTTKIEKKGEDLAVVGDLTLHGVTKSIAFDAKSKGKNASTEFSINRKDFGIEYPGKKDDLIRDGVVIKLNLFAAQ